MTTLEDAAQAIVDPLAYADGARVDEAFAWLRREAPLARVQPEGYDPFWAVTRHADILAVELANDVFRNGDRATTLTTIDADRRVREMNGGSPHVGRSLVHMDPPDHFAYRRITQNAFLPQNLRRLEGRLREIAREFIDRMAAHGGRCDFARDVAFLYPLRVIMELLGVPPSDEGLMLKLTMELFGSADPDVNRSGGEVSKVQSVDDVHAALDDFASYFAALAADRQAHPRDDVGSLIANGRIRGEPMPPVELMSYYAITATAGHDTTSSTTAGGLWALAENPEQFRKLKADPALIPGHVEESIRWVTPVKHFMRTAAADVEIAGQRIARGDWLMLCYASGNRDEAVFDDPFRYDVERAPNKQLAFGYGAHVCLGQHLARMEMRLFWEELLPRLESFELDGEPTRTKANLVCGPKSLPIRYKMR